MPGESPTRRFNALRSALAKPALELPPLLRSCNRDHVEIEPLARIILREEGYLAQEVVRCLAVLAARLEHAQSAIVELAPVRRFLLVGRLDDRDVRLCAVARHADERARRKSQTCR